MNELVKDQKLEELTLDEQKKVMGGSPPTMIIEEEEP